MKKFYWSVAIVILLIQSCSTKKETSTETTSESSNDPHKTRVIFDTDANNELDDQHALAYLLFSGNKFDVAGITVNDTKNGGGIDGQYAEAKRVMELCGVEVRDQIYKGATGSFDVIRKTLSDKRAFDGSLAVHFIIDEAKKPSKEKLVIIAVGKLTNLALALDLDPSITENIRLVWLGSNYPEPGEYNQENDTASVSYVLKAKVEFEIVTVRYGKATGSDIVRMTKEEVNQHLRGKGPAIKTPVAGRHGGTFSTFGNYSVSLFENARFSGNPPSRALFDMVAVAVVKNSSWGQKQIIPAPKLVNSQWIEQPNNSRTITVWGNFDKEKILNDFYQTMEKYQLIN